MSQQIQLFTKTFKAASFRHQLFNVSYYVTIMSIVYQELYDESICNDISQAAYHANKPET